MESSRRRLLIGGLATLLAAQCLYGILTLATLYKSYKTSLVSVQAIASEKFSLDLSRLASCNHRFNYGCRSTGWKI